MLRLKLKWGKQYPKKNSISTQKLRDNAAKFKKELEMNVGSKKAKIETAQDPILNNNNNSNKWKNKLRVNLLKIEEGERNHGR